MRAPSLEGDSSAGTGWNAIISQPAPGHAEALMRPAIWSRSRCTRSARAGAAPCTGAPGPSVVASPVIACSLLQPAAIAIDASTALARRSAIRRLLPEIVPEVLAHLREHDRRCI